MKGLWKLFFMPLEGSIYQIRKGAHKGMKGVVYHHRCGKRFAIKMESGWVCNIRP